MFRLKDIEEFMVEGFKKPSIIQGILRSEYKNEIEKLFIFEKPESMELSVLRVKHGYRDQGVGKNIMKKLIDYADKNNKIIHLTPSDTWGSSIIRLKKYYKSFGFVMNKGKNKNYLYNDTMIRYPG